MPQDRIGYHVVGGASRPRGEAGERTKHRVGACQQVQAPTSEVLVTFVLMGLTGFGSLKGREGDRVKFQNNHKDHFGSKRVYETEASGRFVRKLFRTVYIRNGD
ncbi:predicted protein [Histoplasma mississippiense (nom. inval.)]|uniref:predicted protein n=1 Tax=Ajellomyces capsulatus (strain NAm1 / WU24) TaxID=2059318 RepID=UPI000157C771|nr:predicted protein [Histoplasma mississippiense (nom. inval.)]EDN08876.1 predicted protein [Histoplasma mississippiense (nom. inval.)]